MENAKHDYKEYQSSANESFGSKWPVLMIAVVLFVLILLGTISDAGAQPVVGIIDFYGLKTTQEAGVRKALRITEGDTLRVTTDSLQKRLTQRQGVYGANVSSVCCVEGRSVLFVGVQEGPGRDYPWKKIEGKKIKLPSLLTAKYAGYLTALKTAVSKGDNGDDFSAGHSLFRNPALKKVQTDFIPLANKYFAQLSNVLQHSAFEEQREAAATIIAYAGDKQKVAGQYYEAVTDPSPNVRNNVFRAVTGLGVYAASHKGFRLRLRSDLFVWMLNSSYWSDRDKALFSLMAITENRDTALLQEIKAGALPSLIEMANWKSTGHAVLAYVLLGRIAGMPEEEIFTAWNGNRKEAVFKRFDR